MAKKTGNKKSKSDEKKKSKPMGKRFRLIIPVIVVICIIGVVWFVINPEVAKAESKAQLVIDSGTVQIKNTGGSWIAAENGMLLYESDSVKTGSNSSASVILFRSSIIRLDSNTEITLQEILQKEGENSVKIEQDTGRTWNTISKISGIDNYEVQTPTTIASVRGTSFDVKVYASGITDVSVVDGNVTVFWIENDTVEYTTEINEIWFVTVDFDGIGELEPLELDDWILDNLLEDENFKEILKEDLYARIDPYKSEIYELGITEDEIEILIDGFIAWDFVIPPEVPEEWIKEIFGLP